MSAPVAFPNYTQMRSRVPVRAWQAIRVVSVAAALALAVLLVVRPAIGLFILWGLVVPVLPLVWFLAPGLWRNVCPLAAVNQTPRLFGLSRGREPPAWLRDHGYVVAVLAFLVLVPTRHVLFNASGTASAALLLSALAVAFVGGGLGKGKAGWCSSVCPLLPVQRLYGQTPFAVIPNSHCQPCLGCTRNCYDFNPRVAYLADQYDEDRNFSLRRRFFAGAFPGLIVAFFVVPPATPALELYAWFGLAILLSVGSFFALDALVRATPATLTALYGAVALNLFYWFTAPALVAGLGVGAAWPSWLLRAAVAALTAVWVVRTLRTERRFLEAATAAPVPRVAGRSALATAGETAGDRVEVVFGPDERRVLTEPGVTLLELAERDGLPIEAGCRMGVCGADPVAVLDGADRLSPASADERGTLERLGLGDGARMACCARVLGDVSVSLELDRGAAAAAPAPVVIADPAVRHVVVLGHGIAGATAADHVRRNHPDCTVDIVGRESHHLYNRMAISRLVYGRSAMQGLYLLPDSWYEERRITSWLNTVATGIDRDARTVTLGTGEELPYSRLILACGSRSFVPPLPGSELAGVFVLREAGDAMAVRSYVQDHGARSAIVIGGGLLGLEAAYALSKLALDVTVLERAPRLMQRQLDERGAELLRSYLQGLGITARTGVDIAAVDGDGRARRVRLGDGTVLASDLVLVCIGIAPNVELARDAGLAVGRGVIVDDRLRTSDPDILAAGDVAEHRGIVVGLWPAAVRQAQIAARNAVGGDERYEPEPPVTMLKIVGVDLTSVGRFEPQTEDDTVIALEDPDTRSYRKLLIDADGTVAGAILLGAPRDTTAVTQAVEQRHVVGAHLDRLRAGDWSVLDRSGMVAGQS
jgi:nitrite reductase (NADH) large subunit